MHGDKPGSVDDKHNKPGEPFIAPSKHRSQWEEKKLVEPPFALDEISRDVVLMVIQMVCGHRKWPLHAAHVRTNHIHAIVTSEVKPERVMRDLKAYATGGLKKLKPELATTRTKYWTEHGSTRYLWNEDSFQRAMKYVLKDQGVPMSIFPRPSPKRQ